MRTVVITLSLLFLFVTSKAQSTENLDTWRVVKTRQNMAILGGWALVNIGGGIAGMRFTKGNTYYFHQMNVGWNAVNLGIAAVGYILTKPSGESDPFRLISRLSAMENSLMLNTGLDVAYITSGIALIELSRHQPIRSDQFKGFGQSLILQGAFLAIFDIYQYVVINKKKNQFLKEKLSIHTTPLYGCITFRF
ncbi:DUF6992 family protein [Schleiferia thermophila]|uniref:Uncharacterized protein n=2 Tax=Schleiferia thermophila TaxID=884107 RepID=A0A369A8L2_9FLAO|nr:hypothetical protein [Schleiferia thermophila]RCX05659.1 hypothetical protein DES35_101947 [Schleiferia thermophila]GCD78851.1 hypothetical protein JCM30197_00980 [Schleiferia thermophila]